MAEGFAVDFREIDSRDGFQFERFVEDLLRSLGWTIIQGAGVGPDGGRDLLVSTTEVSATGREFTRRYVVQCRHLAASGRSVAPGDLGHFGLVPEKHGASGWLLVTSTRLTADAVTTIDAARRAHPGNEYDYWDAERLRSELAKDACRPVFRQYLTKSYANAAGILAPSRAELISALSELRKSDDRFSRAFNDPNEDDSQLVAFAISRHVTIAEITALMSDGDLANEFLTIWQRTCARGDVTAAPILMLSSARRLRDLRLRGIVPEFRSAIVAGEVKTTINHRALLRRYWQQFVAYRGVSEDWADVMIDSTNAYVPPIPIAGILAAFYCDGEDAVACGTVRVPGGQELQFIASHQLESNLRVQGPLRTPFQLQLRTAAGSDPVSLVVVGFLDAEVGQWNQLV